MTGQSTGQYVIFEDERRVKVDFFGHHVQKVGNLQ